MVDAPGLAPVHPVAPGMAKLSALRAGGVPDSEIQKFRETMEARMDQAHAPPSVRQAYWGETPAASAIISAAMRANVEREAPYNPQVATNPLEALTAGWQTSVTGLISRNPALGGKGMPDVVVDHNSSVLNTVAAGVGQFAGDLPFAIGGAIVGAGAGGAAGSETGPGAAVAALAGAGAGAAFLPESSRQVLMLSYRSGEIHDFKTFLKLSGEGAWSTAKATAVGAVSNVVGGSVGGQIIQRGGSRVVAGTADVGTQVLTGGALGAAMEGRVPDAKDFTAAAIIALGVHAGVTVHGAFKPSDAGRRVINNTQAVYEATGIPPWELMEAAQRSPGLREALSTQDVRGDPVPNAAMRNITPHPPAPPVRKPPPPVPPVDGMPAPRPTLHIPALPEAQGTQHFTQVMQSIEGGLDRQGHPLVSPAGAIGKNQIMPGTARQYMGDNFDPKTLFDPKVNDEVMRRITADLYRRFNGDEEAMLAGYNAGPGWGARLQRQGPGTRLEAVLDHTVKGGVRYERVAAERNEAILPMETQKYLANARRKSGGPLPGGSRAISGVRGGGGDGGGEPPGGGAGWFEEPRRDLVPQEGGGGGGEGDNPGGPGRFDWGKATDESLFEEIGRGIGEDGSQERGMTPSTAITTWVSELEPLRQIDHALLTEGEYDGGIGHNGGPPLDRDHDMLLEDMGRQVYAANDIAGAMIRYGKVSMEVDPVTGKLMRKLDENSASVLKAAEQAKEKGDILDWEKWMVAKRAADLKSKGIKTPFNDDAVDAVVNRKSLAAKYEEATATLQDALDGGLEYAHQHGLLSRDQITAMKAANPIFVSFRRVAGDDAYFSAKRQGRGFKVGKTFHKMEGSEEGQIASPLQAVMDNMRMLVKNAHRNAVALSIVNLAERNSAAGTVADMGLKKIAFDPEATLSEDGKKAFEAYDADSQPALKEAMEPFLAERQIRGFAPNEFPVFRDGKLEKWRVNDPNLAAFLRGADSPGQADIITKGFEAIAKVSRALVTIPADFAVRMTGIDQWMGYLFDPRHPLPFTTLFHGFADAMSLGGAAKEWIANGGAGASITALDADYLARDVHTIFNETGVFDKLHNICKHPVAFAQLIHERLDWADRIGYYKMAVKEGIDPIKAATMSRKFKLDFAERGAGIITQWMGRTVPFYRVGMLGLKQIGEGLVKNPNDPLYKAATKPAALALRAFGAVTVPVAALYALNYLQDQDPDMPEDRKFRNLPQWQKDTLFISPEIAGVRVKLGMPREIGVLFGGGVNRLLDHFLYNDPVGFDKWATDFLNVLIMPLMPPALRAPLEATTNHSFFTGRPLVPGSLQDASPQMQYSENTTEIAKGLSKLLSDVPMAPHTSPIVIENYVRGLTGSVGMAALQLLDKPFHEAGAGKPGEVADIPFVQGFVVRNPGMGAQPIQDFYDAYADSRAAEKDKSLAKKRRDPQEMADAYDEMSDTARLSAYAKALNFNHQIIVNTYHDPEMGRDEKRQLIEATYSRMIAVARRGTELARARKEGRTPDGPASTVGGPW